jgi:hypothetical protein
MIVLKFWSLIMPHEHYHAQGVVSGHPKLTDGGEITTSRIQKVTYLNGVVEMTTKNNVYELKLCDINKYLLKDTVEKLNKLGLTCITEDICQTYIQKDEEDKLTYADSIIDNNELYLQMIGSTVAFSAFKQDNEIKIIEHTVHIGNYTDSVLVTDFETGIVDFRYFDYGDLIEPYHWSDNLNAIKIENIGGIPLVYETSKSSITCEIGVITTIGNDNTGDEGLISPDAVNGKSMFTLMDLDDDDIELKDGFSKEDFDNGYKQE